jgi:UTP--glucose-1-phosphate uridylyltransferase
MKKSDLKAVIPVAGLGTRMLPATKAIPKEMLPLADKPLIQYIVNECVQAGIKEIILVTHSSKNAIENHFDSSFELETILEKRVKRQLLEDIQSICPNDVTIFHVRQKHALGLGHAILCAEPIIRDHPFVVLLPDVILDIKNNNLSAMIDNFLTYGRNQILVEPVSEDDIDKYGIVDINDDIEGGQCSKINSIVEKPSKENAPSNLAVVGRYVFSSKIWRLIKSTSMDNSGEIQLTDAISQLLNEENCEAFKIIGESYDCGNKLGYIKAFTKFCLNHETLGEEYKKFLNTLLT